jgi:diacylglycerol kinase
LLIEERRYGRQIPDLVFPISNQQSAILNLAMPYRSWLMMFRDAFRGIREGVLGERAFAVHLPMAVAVVAAATFFRVTPTEWLVLILCITLVITAELLNSALERMAKAVTQERNVHVGAALDIAAGAVLLASIGAVICGLIVFVPHAIAWWFASPPGK